MVANFLLNRDKNLIPILIILLLVTFSLFYCFWLCHYARNKLVICNQKLVVKLALEMHKKSSYLDFEDLYSEGNIGLIKAAERFEGSKGARFATFASYYAYF